MDATMWAVLLFVAVAAVVFPVLLVMLVIKSFRQRKLGRRINRFRGRLPLSDQSFFDRFYQNSGISLSIVTGLRHEIGYWLGVPADLLMPTDQFDRELAPNGWEYPDYDADDLLFACVAREEGAGEHIDLGKVATVDDYVRLVGSFLTRHPERRSARKFPATDKTENSSTPDQKQRS